MDRAEWTEPRELEGKAILSSFQQRVHWLFCFVFPVILDSRALFLLEFHLVLNCNRCGIIKPEHAFRPLGSTRTMFHVLRSIQIFQSSSRELKTVGSLSTSDSVALRNFFCIFYEKAFELVCSLFLIFPISGAVRLFHANTYSLENTLNYGMERIWAIACRKGSNRVALGYDEGSTMIKMGKEQPVASMDNSGKIIWARHTEIQMVNVKSATGEAVADGERLPLVVKELGNCEVMNG
jgi:hypothetical protein